MTCFSLDYLRNWPGSIAGLSRRSGDACFAYVISRKEVIKLMSTSEMRDFFFGRMMGILNL